MISESKVLILCLNRITALLLFLLPAASASAALYTFQQGTEVTPGGPTYGGNTDAYLENVRGNANFGDTSPLRVGKNPNNSEVYRAILQFADLETFVGAGETVSDAQLTLRNANVPAQTADYEIEVYVIRSDNAGWIAGNSFASQEVGAVSWAAKEFIDTFGGSIPWVGGDGLGDPGDGYALDPIATITTFDGVANTMTISGLGSLVQSWIDDPSENAGLLFRVPDESVTSYSGFDGSLSNRVEDRPLLEVITIPEPSAVSLTLGIGFLVGWVFWRNARNGSRGTTAR